MPAMMCSQRASPSSLKFTPLLMLSTAKMIAMTKPVMSEPLTLVSGFMA